MSKNNDLHALKKRLVAARDKDGGAAPPASAGQSMSLAYRMSAELIVAILVGAFLGYWLDRWLGTSPILLILLFIFGMATGIRNVLRGVAGMAKDTPDDDN